MAYDNSGSLSKNAKKEKPTHPDYQGQALIDGTEYWLSAWIKEGEKGKWMSLAFKPKEEKAPKAREPEDIPDDIPF